MGWGGGRRRAEPQHQAKRRGPPCTHTFRFPARTRTNASSAPAAQRSESGLVFFEMQLFQGCLSRGGGRGASHELRPRLLPLKKAGAGSSAGAESGGDQGLPRLLQHHRRPRRGSGERLGSLPGIWPAASPSERCSCALGRRSPPPAPRRRQAPPTPPDALSAPRQVLGNFHGGPGPLSRPGLLRLASRDPRSPPLPEKKRTRSHQFIQQRARSLPLRPGLGRHTPGDWRRPRPPSLPRSPNCRLRPVRIRDARLQRAPLSRPCSLETEANNKK